ncbi:hypothetical protein FWF64_03755 [Candidatus Saccharibacteria bacterium]|nr:hypothetical protein [Candidatus Saccharibacteria bacterium]
MANFEKNPQMGGGSVEQPAIREGWDDVASYAPDAAQLAQMPGMADMLPAAEMPQQSQETDSTETTEYREMSMAEIESARNQLLQFYANKSFDEVLNRIAGCIQDGAWTLNISEEVFGEAHDGNIDAIKNIVGAINAKTTATADATGLAAFENDLIIRKLNAKIQEIKDKEEKKEEKKEDDKPQEEAAPDYDSDGGGYDGGYDGGVDTDTTKTTEKPKEEVQEKVEEDVKKDEKELTGEQQRIAIIVEAAQSKPEFYKEIYALAGRLPIESANSLLAETFDHFNFEQRIDILKATEEALDLVNEGADNGHLYGVGILKWFDRKLNNVKGDKEHGTKQSLKEFLNLQNYKDGLAAAPAGNTAADGPNKIVGVEGDVDGSVAEAIVGMDAAELSPELKAGRNIIPFDAADRATPIIANRRYVNQSSAHEQLEYLKKAA